MSTNQDENSLPLSEPSPGGPTLGGPTLGGPTPSVPTFKCLVYLSQDESGASIARVANLDSLQATGASPRDAMARVCREFKERVRGAYAAGETIAWIDPPVEPIPGERVCTIPVHL